MTRMPVMFDGAPYCCMGCVSGGPCLCTYEPSAPALPDEPVALSFPAAARTPAMTRTASAASSAQPPMAQAAAARSIQPAPAAAPYTPRLDGPGREPLPFRRPGSVVVVVHADGFTAQPDLLRFATLVEASPDFTDVSLTRVTTHEAWFTLRAASAQDVAVSLDGFEGFRIQTAVERDQVEAHVTALPEDAASASSRDAATETLLPPRQRFRVFRATTSPSRGAAPAPTPMPQFTPPPPP
ncbi:MAG: hypothetical protein WD800_01315, partial [Dehalococcoidia bacterium]